MSTTQRVIVAAFILAAPLLSQLAEAGPVQTQADVTAPGAELPLGSTVVTPALPAAGSILSPTRQDPEQPATPSPVGAGDAMVNPSASALAADLMREVEAGATAAPPQGRKDPGSAAKPFGPPTAGRQQASGQTQAIDVDGAGEFRQAGKAAMQWLRGVVPGLGGENADPADKVDWTNSRPDGHSSAAGLSAEAALAERRARAQILSQPDAPSRPDGEERPSFAGDHNLVRDAVKAMQEILAHPMTWLVIAIVVIGGVAMSMADRRPK